MSQGMMRRFGNVLGLDNAASEEEGRLTAVRRPQLTIAVYSPKAFEDVQPMADALKEKKAVLIHFDRVDNALGRRIIDYMNGLGYVLGAQAEKVSDGIVLYVPENAEIGREAVRVAKTSKKWF